MTPKKSQKQASAIATVSTTASDINKVSSKHNNKSRKHNSSRGKQQSGNQVRGRSKSKSRMSYTELGGLCLRCGKDNHTAKDYRSNRDHLKCSGCSKTGRVIRVCIKTLMENKSKSSHGATHNIAEYPTSNRDYGAHQIVDIYQNQSASKKAERFYTQVRIGDKPVTCEVDSESKFSFLPRSTFSELKIQAQLLPVPIVFRSYTNHIFTPDRKVVVEVKHQERKSTEELYIVPEEHDAPLG